MVSYFHVFVYQKKSAIILKFLTLIYTDVVFLQFYILHLFEIMCNLCMVDVHPVADSQAKPHAGLFLRIHTYLYVTFHQT